MYKYITCIVQIYHFWCTNTGYVVIDFTNRTINRKKKEKSNRLREPKGSSKKSFEFVKKLYRAFTN